MAMKKHGRGVLKLSTGETYDGQWINDKKDGYGIYKDLNNKEEYVIPFIKLCWGTYYENLLFFF